MLNGPRNNNENSRKGDEEARQKIGGRRYIISRKILFAKIISACKVVFAIIYLGSIIISGVGWLTNTPGYPNRPWYAMWFMFDKAYPYGSDTRVYLVPENGEEQEVDMDQWFKYEVVPRPLMGTPASRKRYSTLAWGINNAAKLAVFVAKKNSQTPMLEGRLKMVKVVHRWWPITRGRRPTEADRTNGQTQIHYIPIRPQKN
jgi:hypothetical protein